MIEPLIIDTTCELGLRQLHDDEVEAAALEAKVRQFRRGLLSPRDLAAWAHGAIGHDGGPDGQPFVELDDMYDEIEFLGYTEEELDEWTRQEADTLLGGTPRPAYERRPSTALLPTKREPNLWARLVAWFRPGQDPASCGLQ